MAVGKYGNYNATSAIPFQKERWEEVFITCWHQGFRAL